MIPFWALVRKDLRLFFSDRRAVLVGLLVPIVCGSFFGYLFGGQGGQTETSRMPVLVIDQDGSAISRAVLVQLSSDKNLEVKPSTPDEARAQVRKGKVTAAVVIPKDFGAEAGRAFFAGGKKPVIGVLYDPSHRVELGMVQGILSGAVMQAVSKEMFTGKSGREMMKESLAQIEKDSQMTPAEKNTLRDLLSSVEEWNEQQEREPASGQAGPSGGLTIPFETHEEAITSGTGVQYNGYAHSFGGMGIQFILFMGLDVGIRLLLLRQSGLWQRLRAAPLSRSLLLGSRAFSAALISGFILMVLFTFARVVFGVHIQGSFLGFLLVCAAFSLMTAAFGLMIAALGKTVEATRGYAIMATLIMVMLGGAWVPTFVFPQWLQKFTVIVPTRWAMDGLDGMTWRGLGLSAAFGPIAVMLFFTLLFGVAAVMRFRWETEG
ncbi:MAG: ABC-2 transporter permease [Terriglobales bacterium]